ncbi:MAG: diguanylate cyclase [Dehalococcoidia bacterium]|nr:diguanylate cyclase [Dehalococcoidia bacterium]
MRLRQIVATVLSPDKEASTGSLAERAQTLHRAAMWRRLLGIGLAAAGLLGLLGVLPLTGPPAAAMLVMTPLLFELEVQLVRRASDVATFDRRIAAFRMTYATVAILVGHPHAGVTWLAQIFLLGIVASAGTALSYRWASLVVGYASAAYVAHLWLVAPGAHQALFAETVFGLLALPLVGWFAHQRVAHSYRSRAALEGTVTRLRRTERELLESQRELERWNGQLNRAVEEQTSELEQRNHYLSIINAVSFALSEPMDDRGSLERAAQLVARLMGARAAQLQPAAGAAGGPGDIFVTVAEDDADVPRVPASVFRTVAEHGLPVTTEHAESGGTLPDIGEPYAVTPLVAKGHVLGGLALIGSARGAWTERERQVLPLIGRELGVAVENVRLYEEAIERVSREQMIAEAGRLLNARGTGDREVRQAFALVRDFVGAGLIALVTTPQGPRRPEVAWSLAGEQAFDAPALQAALRTLPAMICDRRKPLVLGPKGEAPLSRNLRAQGVEALVVAPILAMRTGGYRPADPAAPSAGEPGESLGPAETMVGVLVVALPPGEPWDAAQAEVLDRVAAVLAHRMETDELVQLQDRRITELRGLAQVARIMQTGADIERLLTGFARAIDTLIPYRRLYVARLDETGQPLALCAYGSGGRGPTERDLHLEDAAHLWFRLREGARWTNRAPLPSFVEDGERLGLVIPLRPKGQVLGVAVLSLEAPAAFDQAKIVEQAVEQLALALDGATLYQQATERASHIQALSNLARIVASVVDLREAFDAFAEEVRWLIPFERATMLLVDPAQQVVESYATYPEAPGVEREPRPLSASVMRVPIEAGAPISLDRADARFDGLDWSVLGPDARHVAAVPIRQGTRTTAVFALIQSGDAPYGANELAALDEVAGLLAVTIERLRLYEQAEHSARHDMLTGLPNYRYLQERLASLEAGITDEGQSALIMIDMDALKIFNDTLGHEAGDRVIQTVARVLRSACRAEDFVARTGGDEFVMVMEGVTSEDAEMVAARIHRALRDAHLEFIDPPCPIGISVGIALAPDDAQETAGLLQLADEAMYAAKRAGKSRSVLASAQADFGPGSAVLRRRSNRMLELLVRSCADGATGRERSALALAEQYTLRVVRPLDISDAREAGLRTLVAAEGGQRIQQPSDPFNTRLAGVLVRGIREEWLDTHEEQARAILGLPSVLIDIAWLQIAAPEGPGKTAEEALTAVLPVLRAELPDELVAAVEQVVLAEDLDRRRRPSAA